MRTKVSALLGAILVAGALAGTSVLRAQDETTAKDKKIRKLLEASGELKAARAAFHDSLKKQASNPNLPSGYLKKFRELGNDEFWCDLLAPIYSKHFDEADVDAMLAFYETPLGKKVARERPAMQKEAAASGAEAGAKLAMRVLEELKKDAEKDDDDEDAPKKPSKEPPKSRDGPKPEKTPEKGKPGDDGSE